MTFTLTLVFLSLLTLTTSADPPCRLARQTPQPPNNICNTRGSIPRSAHATRSSPTQPTPSNPTAPASASTPPPANPTPSPAPPASASTSPSPPSASPPATTPQPTKPQTKHATTSPNPAPSTSKPKLSTSTPYRVNTSPHPLCRMKTSLTASTPPDSRTRLRPGPKKLTTFTLLSDARDSTGTVHVRNTTANPGAGDTNLYMSVGPYISQTNRAKGGVVSFESLPSPQTHTLTRRVGRQLTGDFLECNGWSVETFRDFHACVLPKGEPEPNRRVLFLGRYGSEERGCAGELFALRVVDYVGVR